MQRLLTLVVVSALALGACGDDDGTVAGSTSTTAATTTTEDGDGSPTRQCDAPAFSVDYPADWHTNESGPRCRLFHSEPFEVPRDTEFLGAAITISVNRDELAVVYESDTTGPHVREVRDTQSATVDGHEARRAEAVLSDDGLLPGGTRSTTWYVDADGYTIIAVVYDLAVVGSYAANVAVLEDMVRSLRVVPANEVRCSAAGLDPTPVPQPELPDAVAERRGAIVAAAVACDFEALVALADASFTASFGGDEPLTLWRDLETTGDGEPLRFLVGLLDRPFATTVIEGVTRFVWPSAFGYETWEAVPGADRDALQPLYDDDDFADFASFGSYVGYRVGITDDGAWQFFVAGD